MVPSPFRMTVFAAVALALSCGIAHAGQGLLVGVDDDTLKWTEDTKSVVTTQQDLGLGAVRITLHWNSGDTKLDDNGRTYMRRAQAAAKLGMRVVVGVFGDATAPPLTADQQNAFCSYVADAQSRARNVRDYVIWNETNSALFWKPQQGAAAAYESLLATCYDVLHKSKRTTVNVISSTSPHENPAAFIHDLGAAYRASGRTAPIFDTFGHDAYPEVSTESPLASHFGTLSLDEGDYVGLLQALTDAFGGTAQPVPAPGTPTTIWYLEDGFETVVPPDKRNLYQGHESNRQLVQPVAAARRTAVNLPDQASQLRDALQLAYCQPAVGAFFNFQLSDEVQLSGWQSGVLWADGKPKPSYAPFKDLVAAVTAATIDCSRFSPASIGAAPTS
jgi:hypothetical protein